MCIDKTVNGTQTPTTLIGTSDPVDISTMILGSANEVPFIFSTPPAVTANFAVSVFYPTATGDTIAVLQTGESCVDPAKDQYTYLNLTGIGWYAYKTLMASNGMGSFDLFLFAIVSSTTEIQENPLAAMLNIYPNPAADHATIVSLNPIQNVKVINCLGQTISDNVASGLLYNMNTSQFSNGVYIVEIQTAKGLITKKITVNK